MQKKEKPKSHKSITKITALFVVILAVVSGIVLFSLSKKNSTVSPENLIASFQLRSFQDVLPEDKNFAAVEYLFREGILERDENKIFNSAQVLSRAEWVGLLVRLTGITPNVNKYQNCFSDVRNGPNSAAICFAKEQGWLEGFVDKKQTLNHWEFAPAALAQEEKKPFNPDNPVKKDEAIGSLSRLMNWKTNQAVDFAKERKIVEGNAKDTLTKADAANIIYRSVATVPLKNDTYSKKLDNEVKRYKIDDLIDLKEELARQQKEEASYWRRKRAVKYAEMFGEKAAAEIVAEAERYEDVYKAEEAEYDAYIKKAREKNYQQMLEEDKAFGQIPTYNIFEPLQKIFAKRGEAISIDDLIILKSTPPHYDNVERIIDNPVIRSRDGVTIKLYLDENYHLLSRNNLNLAKVKYMVLISTSSFYTDGRTSGHITMTLGNLITGVIEKAAARQFNLDNFETTFQASFHDLEGEIGQMITFPPSNKSSNVDNRYTEGFFEFLDTATGKSSVAFSTAQKPRIIIAADSGVDVRNWLPVRIEIKKDGSNFWSGKIDGDPSQVCRGPSGCSINGPSGIGLDWKKIEITAYDKNGKVVATFSETYNPR